MPRVWSPLILGHVITVYPLFFTLILGCAYRGSQSSHPGFADQQFLFAGRRIRVPQLAALIRLLTLHKRKLRPIRTPLHKFRSASAYPSLRKNRLNGELFLLWDVLRRGCAEKTWERRQRHK